MGFFSDKKKTEPVQPFSQQRWLTFFLAYGIITLLFVVLSHWVFINGAGSRFFFTIHLSFWIAFLIYLQANGSRNRALRVAILLLIVLTGSFSSCYQFYFPERIPPTTRLLNELKPLGDIGIIADYQLAYVSASADPAHIKATPHDKDWVRNGYLMSEVFRQPRIFLIKDNWLKVFPDTINQFGHILIKKEI